MTAVVIKSKVPLSVCFSAAVFACRCIVHHCASFRSWHRKKKEVNLHHKGNLTRLFHIFPDAGKPLTAERRFRVLPCIFTVCGRWAEYLCRGAALCSHRVSELWACTGRMCITCVCFSDAPTLPHVHTPALQPLNTNGDLDNVLLFFTFTTTWWWPGEIFVGTFFLLRWSCFIFGTEVPVAYYTRND